MEEWWKDHMALHRLAAWMSAEGYLIDAVVDMLEKPWNWSEEYSTALAETDE